MLLPFAGFQRIGAKAPDKGLWAQVISKGPHTLAGGQACLSNAEATLRITHGFDPRVMPIKDVSIYGSQMENHRKRIGRSFLKYSQM